MQSTLLLLLLLLSYHRLQLSLRELLLVLCCLRCLRICKAYPAPLLKGSLIGHHGVVEENLGHGPSSLLLLLSCQLLLLSCQLLLLELLPLYLIGWLRHGGGGAARLCLRRGLGVTSSRILLYQLQRGRRT
jgi:hypothetical protein